ncbi:MAG: DNA methyltransferase, partial [Candidatus Cryptobacteroides sp.]
DNFQAEIIWKRMTASGFKGKYNIGHSHDTLYWYSMSPDCVYNPIVIPYSKEYINQRFSKKDENGRYFKDEKIGTATTTETIERLKKEGRIYYTSNGTMRIKHYLDEVEGMAMDDVWTDIYAANSQAEERVDYATQKPEALLERIIKASSDKGMLVADFFGGSGVAAAVASKNGRRFIHCDINLNSIQTARDRLVAQKAEFEMLEIKDGVSLYRNPVQTMDKLKSLIPGLRNEDSLDKFWEGCIVDTKYGMMPVYLPNLMDGTTRLLDKPLMNQIIREALPDLPDNIKRVIVYYTDMIDRAEIEQFIKEQNNRTTIEIELRDLKQVLDEVVVEDEAQWQLDETQDGLWRGWKVTVNSFHSDRVLRKIEEVNFKGEQQAQQQRARGKAKTFHQIQISDEGLETIEWLSLDCQTAEKDAPWHSDVEIKINRLGYVILNGTKTGEFWDGTIKSEQKPLRLKIRNICGDESTFVI